MKLNNFNEDGTGKPKPVRNMFTDMSAAFQAAYGASVSQMVPDHKQLAKILAESSKKRSK